MPLHFNNYSAAIRRAISAGIALGLTAHEVCIGTAGGGLGQVPAVGTAGQVLTSNGAGNDPSWQAAAGGGTDFWPSALEFPTGLGYTVLGETYPRLWAQTGGTLSSGTPRIIAIPLEAGVTVSRITFCVEGTAEAGGSGGWYAFGDTTGGAGKMKIQAVSANQTGATVWSPTLTPITLTVSPSFTTPNKNTYYVAVCVVATTLPTLSTLNSQGSATGALNLAPTLCGLGPFTPSPPAVGTTLAITATENYLWATVG